MPVRGGRSLSASNLYDVGAVLGQTAEACIRAGATPVFVHHTTKSSAGQDRPTALADLSFAGVGEFARQWLLLSRQGDYAPGTGRHDLVAAIGGSAGHSSQWRVRIGEGSTGDEKRIWDVNLTPNVLETGAA